MRKIVVYLAPILLVSLFLFSEITPAKASVAATAEIIGDITIGVNSPIELKITNNSTANEQIKNVAIWVPQTWYIAFPAHNMAIRNRTYGPWSTQVFWSGYSARQGWDAIWFKATTGVKRIPAGMSETFPLTLRTPTSQKMFPQVKSFYWAVDDGTGKGGTVRGEVTANVVEREVAGISTVAPIASSAASSIPVAAAAGVALVSLAGFGLMRKK